MDRRSARDGTGRRRFPRPRGDGPSLCSTGSRTSSVSPPTRGWTHSARARCALWRGFPAHAGMDLRAADAHRLMPRFPRPRGDGPTIENVSTVVNAVSPPTRGWTRSYRTTAHDLRGFPAHAGMDLYARRYLYRTFRFPRPRGDGPKEWGGRGLRFTVSPPTRGWTVIRANQSRITAGFPAHAGMDRFIRSPQQAGTGFPRPRGDGPSSHHARPS